MSGVIHLDRELPHESAATQVMAGLRTDADQGLTAAEAAKRWHEYGPNALPAAKTRPAWLRFLGHFRDAQVYLLLFAAGVSLLVWAMEGTEELPLEAIAILAIVLLNALFGYLQEERAGQALAALRSMTPDEASVLRDGELQRIEARQLVPGDLLVVREGDRIAADARLVEVTAFHTQEAALTGESVPVLKTTAPLPRETAAADRHNMVFSGTIAVSGHARAVVTATGAHTEFGRIAAMLRETGERATPLQQELDRLGRKLGAAVIIIAAVVVGTMLLLQGVHDGKLVIRALLFGVALAVAATPEGLAAVVTVVLALGVQRMARRGAIIRHLKAVETLGEATVIACDKTGTMTLNEMSVRRVVTASGEAFASGSGYEPDGDWTLPQGGELPPAQKQELITTLRAAALVNNASLQRNAQGWKMQGDPTEAALLVAAVKAGEDLTRLTHACPRTGEIPFSSERKRMSTLHHCVGDATEYFSAPIVLLAKGAADLLLEQCTHEAVNGQLRSLTPERRREWLRTQEEMAAQALRTLGIAMKPLSESEAAGPEPSELLEQGLTFLGMVGMIDPPRPEARAAVATARSAGVRTIMITGDHAATALAIARDLDITPTEAITGNQITAMSDKELAGALQQVSVFARVNPEHKLRIVRALQSNGEIVAMTGDGVNDAPALKAADIGVAMGITGTDVAKEAADLVLTDDNFATIVAAIEEGRGIFDNIRKFLRYLLATNAGEILTLFLAVALTVHGTGHADGLMLPLLAVQILWINLITDGAPALALGLEPPSGEVMARTPSSAGARMIDRAMMTNIAAVAAIMAAGTLYVFFTTGGSMELRRTMAFTTLILFQLFNAFQARSSTHSVFSGIFRNTWLWITIGAMLLLQILVLDMPAIANAFGVVPLPASLWLRSTLAASSVIWGMEVVKWWRRYLSRRSDAVNAR